MRSRTLSVICGVSLLLGIASAAAVVIQAERTLDEIRLDARQFDLQAREVADLIGELRTAQEAYVAAGQSADLWMPRVDVAMTKAMAGVAALRVQATSSTTKAQIDEAEQALAELSRVDQNVRGYLASDARLMAADIILTEGSQAATNAAAHVAQAQVLERRSFDTIGAGRRKLEALALAGAIVLAVLVAAVLLFPTRTAGSVAATHLAPEATIQGRDDLSLQPDQPSRLESPATQHSLPQPDLGPALRAAGEICTALGRVTDPDELATLLARAAEVLDASGLVVWQVNTAGTQLRPALTHGYPADALARMPTLARSSNNAVGTALRTATLQIVAAQPGSKGAIAAPILAPDGCIGVLSAELRDGREASSTTQALAAILAAQLAGLVSVPTAASEPPAVASGG